MLIIGILVFGMFVGWLAQLVLRRGQPVDWQMALISGWSGSFVGGLIGSLISGEGFDLHATGLIGSFVGALVVTGVWLYLDGRK